MGRKPARQRIVKRERRMFGAGAQPKRSEAWPLPRELFEKRLKSDDFYRAESCHFGSHGWGELDHDFVKHTVGIDFGIRPDRRKHLCTLSLRCNPGSCHHAGYFHHMLLPGVLLFSLPLQSAELPPVGRVVYYGIFDTVIFNSSSRVMMRPTLSSRLAIMAA